MRLIKICHSLTRFLSHETIALLRVNSLPDYILVPFPYNMLSMPHYVLVQNDSNESADVLSSQSPSLSLSVCPEMRIFSSRFIPFSLSRPTLRFPPNLPLPSSRIPPPPLSLVMRRGEMEGWAAFLGDDARVFFCLLSSSPFFSARINWTHFPRLSLRSTSSLLLSVFYTSDRHTWAKGSEDFVLFLLKIKVMFQKI